MPKVRGRPPKGDEAKRHSVSFRATPDLMEKLDAAIARSGRSLAHEVEQMLERSAGLDAEFGDKLPLLRAISHQIERAEAISGRPWHADLATHYAVRSLVPRLLWQWVPTPENFDEVQAARKAAAYADFDFRWRLKMLRQVDAISRIPTLMDAEGLTAWERQIKAIEAQSDDTLEQQLIQAYRVVGQNQFVVRVDLFADPATWALESDGRQLTEAEKSGVLGNFLQLVKESEHRDRTKAELAEIAAYEDAARIEGSKIAERVVAPPPADDEQPDAPDLEPGRLE